MLLGTAYSSSSPFESGDNRCVVGFSLPRLKKETSDVIGFSLPRLKKETTFVIGYGICLHFLD